MTKYRIISELDVGAEHREPRGSVLRLDEARLMTLIEAGSLAEAAVDARDISPHNERRIISVEEIHPGLTVSDELITRALADPDYEDVPILDPEDFTDDTSGFDRVWLVQQIVYGLRASGLVPGLGVSVLNNELDEPYAMVEIHDDARRAYLSRGCEIRKLTEDRSATGWDGVLAIARFLISFSNDLH